MLTRYLGKSPNKKETIQILCLAILGALSASGFAFIGWGKMMLTLTRVIYFAFFCYFLIIPKRKYGKNFYSIVLLLLFLPFTSMINSYIYYSQSPFSSINASAQSFLWILYFALHRFKVKEATILRAFLILALFIVAVQIIQQFTYPTAYFGVASEEAMYEEGAIEKAEMRNGLWRFRMHMNGYFTAPILFAMWIWLKKKMKMNLFLLTSILLVSIYLTLTRQVMFACILAIVCSFFMERKISFKAIFLIALFVGGLYVFYDILFSSLAEQTSEESTEDNIRILSANYFWNESLRSPLTFLLGMGRPWKGAFEKAMKILNEQYGYYVSDVGVVGQIYEKGVLYVITCYYLLYKLFFKLRYKIPTYVRMFVIFAGIMSPMIFPFINSYMFVPWAMLLYVCDLHINASPLRIKSTSLLKYRKKHR